MKLTYAIRSHRGLVRRNNEDACGAWPTAEDGSLETPAALFAVADGMGGHPAGDIASSLAVKSALVAQEPIGCSAGQHLRAIYRQVSEGLEAEAQRRPETREMGTTLTVALFLKGLIWVGQVGDSRLYWIREDAHVRVTRDHTLASDLTDRGLLSPEEADQHPSSHMLTRCLGVCQDQDPDVSALPLLPEVGDTLLLATDGLARVLNGQRIALLIRDASVSEAAERLEAAVLAGGAPDNITVVVVRVVDPGREAPAVPGVRFTEVETMQWTKGRDR